MSGMMELTRIEMVIQLELELDLSQEQIAHTYALGLCSSWPTDWEKVNAIIIEKWSAGALVRIKDRAHAILQGYEEFPGHVDELDWETYKALLKVRALR
jgi:hypothetical protein